MEDEQTLVYIFIILSRFSILIIKNYGKKITQFREIIRPAQ